MKEKRPVYNGYEERYVSGLELKSLFSERYLTAGRHHSTVLGISIPEYLCFLKIDDSKTYRIFLAPHFCRVMKGDTDGLISFFGYTALDCVKLVANPNDIHLEKTCAKCGSPMEFKTGRYGEFLGCSNYPTCKSTTKIPIIGYDNPSFEQMEERMRQSSLAALKSLKIEQGGE